MKKEIQEQGAKAAAMGAGLLDCPFYRIAHLPAYTNETLYAWRKRVEAWEAGWFDFQEKRRSEAA